MGHGLQKLAGWFGGHGLHATGQSFESMGLPAGEGARRERRVSETAGGALAAGLLTRLSASLLSGTMIHGDPQGPTPAGRGSPKVATSTTWCCSQPSSR